MNTEPYQSVPGVTINAFGLRFVAAMAHFYTGRRMAVTCTLVSPEPLRYYTPKILNGENDNDGHHPPTTA